MKKEKNGKITRVLLALGEWIGHQEGQLAKHARWWQA
jgi:hypothetical protein